VATPSTRSSQGTKLFSAGTPGLTQNDQWTTWVRAGHGEVPPPNPGLDMYGRARLLGGPGVGLTDVIPPAHPSSPSAGCTLEMHYSTGVEGPWLFYPNATITPCGSNNPAPWVLPNGTIYIVFTDQNMCVGAPCASRKTVCDACLLGLQGNVARR